MEIYGCNTAHQDYKNSNVAYEFFTTQNILAVTGWDGRMRWGRIYGEPRLAGGQHYFESWLKDQQAFA